MGEAATDFFSPCAVAKGPPDPGLVTMFLTKYSTLILIGTSQCIGKEISIFHHNVGS